MGLESVIFGGPRNLILDTTMFNFMELTFYWARQTIQTEAVNTWCQEVVGTMKKNKVEKEHEK